MSSTPMAVGTHLRIRCSTCKRVQLHVITALSGSRVDQIQCKVCLRSRKYRTKDGANGSSKRRRQEAAEVIPPEVIWKKLLEAASERKTIPYTFDKQYQVHDLINHDTFGLGVVTDLPGPDKARVAFKEGELLLICNR
jgi:hypothetical protein